MNQAQKKYGEYLKQHLLNVRKAYEFLLPSIKQKLNLSENELALLAQNIRNHDVSKLRMDEFAPYAQYCFGEKDDEAKVAFDKAETLHKQRNPHHAEYWAEKKEEMPTIYVVEMVCDWWSFSLVRNQPLEVFDFFQKHSFSQKTKQTIDVLFSAIKEVAKDNFEK